MTVWRRDRQSEFLALKSAYALQCLLIPAYVVQYVVPQHTAIFIIARFKVFVAVYIQAFIFWFVTTCNFDCEYQHFGGNVLSLSCYTNLVEPKGKVFTLKYSVLTSGSFCSKTILELPCNLPTFV